MKPNQIIVYFPTGVRYVDKDEQGKPKPLVGWRYSQNESDGHWKAFRKRGLHSFACTRCTGTGIAKNGGKCGMCNGFGETT